MLSTYCAVSAFLVTRRHLVATHGEAGQATSEYALVLLGAATVALMLLAWATKSGAIGRLFDAVFDSLSEEVR